MNKQANNGELYVVKKGKAKRQKVGKSTRATSVARTAGQLKTTAGTVTNVRKRKRGPYNSDNGAEQTYFNSKSGTVMKKTLKNISFSINCTTATKCCTTNS